MNPDQSLSSDRSHANHSTLRFLLGESLPHRAPRALEYNAFGVNALAGLNPGCAAAPRPRALEYNAFVVNDQAGMNPRCAAVPRPRALEYYAFGVNDQAGMNPRCAAVPRPRALEYNAFGVKTVQNIPNIATSKSEGE